MSEYPEHDKMAAVRAETQAVGEFLDWAAENGMVLMQVDEGHPYIVQREQQMAAWAGIDLTKIDDEKRAMLAKLRGAQ